MCLSDGKAQNESKKEREREREKTTIWRYGKVKWVEIGIETLKKCVKNLLTFHIGPAVLVHTHTQIRFSMQKSLRESKSNSRNESWNFFSFTFRRDRWKIQKREKKRYLCGVYTVKYTSTSTSKKRLCAIAFALPFHSFLSIIRPLKISHNDYR